MESSLRLGRNGWETRLKKYGLEEVLKQCSKGREVSVAKRKEKAEKKEQQLIQLAKTGAPFWAKAEKGDIAARIW